MVAGPSASGRNWLFGPWACKMMVGGANSAAAEWRELMGLAMSVPQLLIILVIVALIFGTKRLKEVGGDLGSAVKSFRKAMNTANEVSDESADPPKQLTSDEKEKTK